MSRVHHPHPPHTPLIDLSRHHERLREEILLAIERVYASQRFLGGAECGALESEVAKFCGAKYAIGCANGTDALVVSLRALEIGRGDEVIVPAYSFFATAEAVSLVGATPVFADIDLPTFLIDAGSVETAISPRTAAILPVHLFGQVAPMEEVNRIAQRHGLVVIADSAQAIGSTRHEQPIGQLSLCATLSFYPTKNLGGVGDGGMILTSDVDLTGKIRKLCNHGQIRYGVSDEVGYNSRLDTLQAAVLRVKLSHLEEWNSRRWEHAEVYSRFFSNEQLPILPPATLPGNLHTYHQYVIRTERRDHLQSWLSEHLIGTAVYYPLPLPLQPAYASLGYKAQDFPNAWRASQESLALPVFPELLPAEQERILEVLRQWRL